MTEAEWLACEDREKLQIFLRFHPSAPRVRDFERRLRLYTCGCCRLVWDAYPYDACRHGVEIAEAYADGEADTIALAEARAALQSHPMPAAVLEEVDTPIGRRRRPSGAEWNAYFAGLGRWLFPLGLFLTQPLADLFDVAIPSLAHAA